MKEFSKELIEIDGVEYTLFLNRKGLVSWENITKVTKKADDLKDKYKDTQKLLKEGDPIKVSDTDNPFDYAGKDELEEIEKDEKEIKDIYIKFYWIALYENHKLPLNEVTNLFEKAEEEYGIEQLIELANQMIETTNINKYGNRENKELKKLTALHQTK